MGQPLTATLESAAAPESSLLPSPKKLSGSQFKRGGDPRRFLGGRPVGALSKQTIDAREIAREILTPRTADACNVLVSLLGEYKDKSDPCPDCQRTPCKTCGRGVPADPCPLCGRGMLRDEDTRFKAVQDILDRVGVPKQTQVKLEATVDVRSVAFIKHLTDDELTQIQQLIDLAQERALLAGDVAADEPTLEEEEVL